MKSAVAIHSLFAAASVFALGLLTAAPSGATDYAPPAQRFIPSAPSAPTAQRFIPTVPTVAHNVFYPHSETVPEPDKVDQPYVAPPAQRFIPSPPMVSEARTVQPVQMVPPVSRFYPQPEPAPQAEHFYP